MNKLKESTEILTSKVPQTKINQPEHENKDILFGDAAAAAVMQLYLCIK